MKDETKAILTQPPVFLVLKEVIKHEKLTTERLRQKTGLKEERIKRIARLLERNGFIDLKLTGDQKVLRYEQEHSEKILETMGEIKSNSREQKKIMIESIEEIGKDLKSLKEEHKSLKKNCRQINNLLEDIEAKIDVIEILKQEANVLHTRNSKIDLEEGIKFFNDLENLHDRLKFNKGTVEPENKEEYLNAHNLSKRHQDLEQVVKIDQSVGDN